MVRRWFIAVRWWPATAALALTFTLTHVPTLAATQNATEVCAAGWQLQLATSTLPAQCAYSWQPGSAATRISLPDAVAGRRVSVTVIGGLGSGTTDRASARVGEVTGNVEGRSGDVMEFASSGASGDLSLALLRNDSVTSQVVAAGSGSSGNVAPADFTAGFNRADSSQLSTATLAYPIAARGKATLRTAVSQGATPFMAQVFVDGVNLAAVTKSGFTILPQASATVPALTSTFSSSAMTSRGYLDSTLNRVSIPIYGLYAGRVNQVRVWVQSGMRTLASVVSIATPTWSGVVAANLGSKETFVARRKSAAMGFHYVLLKYYASAGVPVVFDIDGEPRWAGPTADATQAVAALGNAFFLASTTTPTLTRVDLDGRRTEVANYAAKGFLSFHHNADPGKAGLLLETDIPGQVRSTVVDVRADGSIAGSWDVATAIADAMRARGDDPSILVRQGQNWCHMNAAAYWPAQDQVVVSCREQFVAAMDYATGQLRWLIGDPEKSWHQYASLRALALTVQGNPPIGQHAISFPRPNELMLFDNGVPSNNAGVGQPIGAARLYSAPRKYRLDLKKRTATEVWTYGAERNIYCRVTGSVYQMGQSMLINYASELNQQYVRLVGLDRNGVVAFEYRWKGLQTLGWNAVPYDLSGRVW